MTSEIYNRTYQALENLFLNSKETQELLKENKNFPKDLAFLKEFCTIRMTTSRRSGHSTAITKLITDHLIGNDIAIVNYNFAMSNRFHELLLGEMKRKNIYCKKITESTIYTEFHKILFFAKDFSKDEYDAIRGYSFDAIIIDNSFLASKSFINNIYVNLMHGSDKNKYLILVQ